MVRCYTQTDFLFEEILVIGVSFFKFISSRKDRSNQNLFKSKTLLNIIKLGLR